MQLLQEGGGRRIVVEAGGTVVRKTFSSLPQEEARRLARQEYERLQRLTRVTLDVPGAVFPRPLELLSDPVPAIRMELLSGEPLVDVLASSPMDPGWRWRVARTMVRALRAYVDAVAEPFPDFQLNNMLWDRSSHTLGLVDLGEPDRGRSPGATSPFEAGIANLLASTVFQSARPRWLARLRQHRQAIALCGEVVAAALNEPERLDLGDLLAAARAAYVREAYGGGMLASTWYGSVGFVAGRRIKVHGLRFGPVPPHPLLRARAG